MRDGYFVRATVRDPKQTDKVEHLINIAKEVYGEKHEEALQFFKADLLEENAYDESCSKVDAVMHVASAVFISFPSNFCSSIFGKVTLSAKDPEKELVQPAVNGTVNVLKSCAKNKIKKVSFLEKFTFELTPKILVR